MQTKPPTFHYNFTIAPNGVLHGMRLGPKDALKDGLMFHVQLDVMRGDDHWKALPPRLRDLTEVIKAVHAADRLSPRHEDRDGYGWGRHLFVSLPVYDLDFWREAKVDQCLRRLVGSLTTDEWHFEWKQRADAPGLRSIQERLFEVEAAPSQYVLLSGGLDSLAGVCDLACNAVGTRFGLVSVVTADRVAGAQHAVCDALASRFRGRVHPTEVRLDLSRSSRGLGLHRSRSFVFQTLGAISAYVGGATELYQCENGVASLCLPLRVGSFPWETARGVHPRFLHEMGSFLSLLFAREFRVRNPFLLKSKAELCGAIRQAGLEGVIGATVSCDRFPQRIERTSVCGKCGPCILRRQSLHASGLASFDHTDRYRYDVTKAHTVIPRESRKALDAMLGQRERIRQALATEKPWLALTRSYPELEMTKRYIALAVGRDEPEVRQELLRLLGRYAAEWDHFPMCATFPDSSELGDRRHVRAERPQMPTLPLHDPVGQAE